MLREFFCLLFSAAYLEEIQSVRRHTNSMLDTSKSLNPPVVVHCSAGVGRTGVVILTELMIRCLEHNEVRGWCPYVAAFIPRLSNLTRKTSDCISLVFSLFF